MAKTVRRPRGSIPLVAVVLGLLAGLYGMHVAPMSSTTGCDEAGPAIVMSHSATHHGPVDRIDTAGGMHAGMAAMCVPNVPRDLRWLAALLSLSLCSLLAARGWATSSRPVRHAAASRRSRPPPRPGGRRLLVDICVSRT